MADYLSQVPKQLAARRKAFAAASSNPALLPSCWAIVRSIANNINEYNRNAVIGGCTFPDRPVYLSPDDAAFLNLGTTPKLLRMDNLWLEAEKQGKKEPDPEAELSPEHAEKTGRDLAALARLFGRNQAADRVYNLEPWLQDMYRDRLDVDYAEDLQRQIDALNAYMDSVPRTIQSSGLPAKLAKGVTDSFILFRTITGSSHQLDREKMSFTDRRSYVNTIQKIETIMIKADEALGSARAGKSVIRELFALWKNANYEMMKLTRQLRVLWAGTSLDDRISELANLHYAIQQAVARGSEESRSPQPQLPVFRADQDPTGLTRDIIVDAFNSVSLYDLVIGANTQLASRELRRYGPLCVVISPGNGQPRYCSEMRKLHAKDDEDSRKKKPKETPERESDVARRIHYPLNCLVVPVNADASMFLEDMADAYLEHNQIAFPVQFKEFLEGAKSAAPDAFLPPEGKESKDLPPTYARQMLARLLAGFVRWALSGAEPGDEEKPCFEAFREVALSRLNSNQFLIPLRYRPLLDLFVESGAKRRQEIWKRTLGPRFALDRQLVAVNILQKDWKALHNSLRYLPRALTQNNSNLNNGFGKAKDASDPFAEHKAIALFRKFLEEDPDLKAALSAVESQTAMEVETLRTQSESLGRVFQYDQASATMMARQASQIQEKRNATNTHIDQYLTGLMYALDGNLEAAEVALSMCLTPCEKRQSDTKLLKSVPEQVGQEWFEENMPPLEGKFEKRKVPGEDSAGTICYDFIYYNLGLTYQRLGRHIEARMSFLGVDGSSDPERSHLLKQWASEHAETAKQAMEGGDASGK